MTICHITFILLFILFVCFNQMNDIKIYIYIIYVLFRSTRWSVSCWILFSQILLSHLFPLSSLSFPFSLPVNMGLSIIYQYYFLRYSLTFIFIFCELNCFYYSLTWIIIFCKLNISYNSGIAILLSYGGKVFISLCKKYPLFIF